MQQIASSAVIPQNVSMGPFCVIGEGVVLGENVTVGAGCIISDNVKVAAESILGNHVTLGESAVVGEKVTIGDHTTVYSGVSLGDGCFVGSNSSIGRLPRPAATSTVKVQSNLSPLSMGTGCTVGCSAVLYAGTTYADGVLVGDQAVVREGCTVGENVIIGSGVVVENKTKIGAFTKIQSGSYITAYMDIAERVFIAPMVTTTNDNFMGRTEKRFDLVKGPVIERGARIGGGSILLPGIKIAQESFIAAGALVTKDTDEKKVFKGFPAKELRVVPEEELLSED